jgi:hypothetical protein
VATGGLGEPEAALMRTQIYNLRVDAAVTALFMSLVGIIVLQAGRKWYAALRPGTPPDFARTVVDA